MTNGHNKRAVRAGPAARAREPAKVQTNDSRGGQPAASPMEVRWGAARRGKTR